MARRKDPRRTSPRGASGKATSTKKAAARGRSGKISSTKKAAPRGRSGKATSTKKAAARGGAGKATSTKKAAARGGSGKAAARRASTATAGRGVSATARRHAAESSLLDQLVQRARDVRDNAHAPYSGYHVGAAIATKSGRIFAGCNVENASFGATICAERGAIMQMVASGERDLVACAVVTADGGSPCGICRQVLAEFARDIPVVLVGLDSPDGETGRVVQLADLLPLAFELRR